MKILSNELCKDPFSWEISVTPKNFRQCVIDTAIRYRKFMEGYFINRSTERYSIGESEVDIWAREQELTVNETYQDIVSSALGIRSWKLYRDPREKFRNEKFLGGSFSLTCEDRKVIEIFVCLSNKNDIYTRKLGDAFIVSDWKLRKLV